MGELNEPLQLRPLSIGEIFDRAVTLFVRNWIPLGVIMIVGIGPTSIADYLAAAVNPSWAPVSKLLELLGLVSTMATALIIAQIYKRQAADWRGALAKAFSRLLPALGATLTLILIAILPLLIIVGIPAGLGVFRFANLADDAVALLTIVAGGAICIAMFFGGSYAANTIAIEDCGAMDAVGRTLALFNRQRLARTMLFALAQTTLVFGGAFAVGMLITLIHNIAAATFVEAVLLIVLGGLGNVINSVFYFDVAIRSEGYDLQVALDAMPT